MSLSDEEEALLRSQDSEGIFTYIHDHRLWGGSESVSGPGSDLKQTAKLISEFPDFLNRHGITSILDLPCGDFHWMRRALPDDVEYVGGDIVETLVESNQAMEKRPGIRFEKIDLLTGPLPSCDMLICRDCLVHLSYDHIRQALQQIVASEIRFLLTTTFNEQPGNQDILTGMWRPLNLEAEPFHFPSPIDVIVEGCSEVEGAFPDKCLSLWLVEDIPL